MKLLKRIFSCLILSISASGIMAQMQFVAPVPGSGMHNPNRNIVLRPGSLLDPLSVVPLLFKITGSVSGSHDFNVKLANDGKTINLNPFTPFAFGEQVTVEIMTGMREQEGNSVDGYHFSFYTHRKYSQEEEQQLREAETSTKNLTGLSNINRAQRKTGPEFRILVNNNASRGNVFFSNFSSSTSNTQKMWIIKNDGEPVFEFGGDSNTVGFDWKLNHNHYLTAFNTPLSFDMFDSNYVFMRSFKPKNGYTINEHEFQIFPDGHYYLIADDPQIIDMTVYDSTYQSNAKVIGNVIQEFDNKDNLIFEWRTFDHISIPEAIHANLRSALIDAIHMNSIEEDLDGNIIVSMRHLDQVDKIDVATGHFIWRFGGQKNEFSFAGQPVKFTYQHDARRIANGHITIFDNNNFGVLEISYAKEYELDEVNKKARLVWSYAHPPVNGSIPYSVAMGGVERLPNGNTLITWGWIPDDSNYPSITEVDRHDNIVWELQCSPQHQDLVYRAHRCEWQPCARPSDSKLIVTDIMSTSATINWNAANGAVRYRIQYRPLGSFSWKSVIVPGASLSYSLNNLLEGTPYEWQIQSLCSKSKDIKSGYTAVHSFTTGLLKRPESIDGRQSLEIYPNPVSDFINLTFKGGQKDEQMIRIFNSKGETVLSETFTGDQENSLKMIDVHALRSGIYLIQIITSTGTFQSQFCKL